VTALRLHPAAELEIEAAAEFYALQSSRLVVDFINEIEAAFAAIRELPLAGSPDRVGVRRHYLHRFPFTIVYEVTAVSILVLAVAHQRRRPGYWTQRQGNK
jgi:toxin ParE1/3/4